MRTFTWMWVLAALMWCVPATAEEAAEDAGCCRAVGHGLPIAAVAEAVVTAGDKPLWVLPDDPSRIDFDLEGVCIEHLVNGLLKAQKLRAKDCGKSFGLFGLDVPADKARCDAVAAPRQELPPGHLEGWALTGVFTQRHGERMAALSGPDGQVYIISGNAQLASEGTSVEGLGDRGLVVVRGGVSTLDGSLAPMSTLHMGEVAAPSCTELPPEPVAPPDEPSLADEEAAAAPEGEAGEPAAGDDEAAEDREGEGTPEEPPPPPEPVFACDGLEVDFIQRPLPPELVDDPAFTGKEVEAVVEFGPDGWARRIVSVQCDPACRATLGAAIKDWRIVPVEVAPGTLGRVRVTVPFVLEIPCR